MVITEKQLTNMIKNAINEAFSSWDNAEFSAQRRANAALKKKLMANRGIEPKKTKPENNNLVQNDDKLSIIVEKLKDLFLNRGREALNDPDAKAIKQFMVYTGLKAENNSQGGSMFTMKNKQDPNFLKKYGNIYRSLEGIKEIYNDICLTLRSERVIDQHRLELISYKFKDLADSIGNVAQTILNDPSIKNDNSKFMNGDAKHPGFKDVLRKVISGSKRGYLEGIYAQIMDAVNYDNPFSSKNTRLVSESNKNNEK